jgi:hypothetical protein
MMRRTIRAACLALALSSQAAMAQQAMPPGMHIPDAAKVAVVEFFGDGQLTLNGKPSRLSGASQIRGTTNLIILSQALRGKYRMRVLLDESDSIHRAWIMPNNS